MSETARNYLLQSDSKENFTKNFFEVSLIHPRPNTFYDSNLGNTKNVPARIINSLIAALMRKGEIPKYLIIILEDDLIEYLNYNDYGVTEMLGKLVDYMARNIKNIFCDFKAHLPTKAKRVGWPHIVWLAPTTNNGFNNNTLRKKLSNEIHGVVSQIAGMTCLKLRQVWNIDDFSLTANGKISAKGLQKMWQATDRTIRYADWKTKEAEHHQIQTARGLIPSTNNNTCRPRKPTVWPCNHCRQKREKTKYGKK